MLLGLAIPYEPRTLRVLIHTFPLTHILTHSRPPTLTLSLTHAHTHSLSYTHSPTLSHTHTHTLSLTHSLRVVGGQQTTRSRRGHLPSSQAMSPAWTTVIDE